MELGPFGLALLALALLAAFGWLSRLATGGSDVARGFALLELVILGFGAGLGAFLGLFLNALRCDEGCDEESEVGSGSIDWWHTDDAWQWPAQLVLALAGLLLICWALVAAWRDRYWRALALLSMAAACFAGWVAFLAPLGDEFGV